MSGRYFIPPRHQRIALTTSRERQSGNPREELRFRCLQTAQLRNDQMEIRGKWRKDTLYVRGAISGHTVSWVQCLQLQGRSGRLVNSGRLPSASGEWQGRHYWANSGGRAELIATASPELRHRLLPQPVFRPPRTTFCLTSRVSLLSLLGHFLKSPLLSAEMA